MSCRCIALSVILLAFAGPAFAKTVDVKMKTVGATGMMVFEPAYVQAAPGDTIRFLPTDPGHNAQTIDGMVPEGAPPVVGPMGKELDLKVSKAGLYGIECKPHFGMGMVALIKVGAGPSPNAVAAKAAKLPPLAAKRMIPMLAMAK